jgi:hypothetical protein
MAVADKRMAPVARPTVVAADKRTAVAASHTAAMTAATTSNR